MKYTSIFPIPNVVFRPTCSLCAAVSHGTNGDRFPSYSTLPVNPLKGRPQRRPFALSDGALRAFGALAAGGLEEIATTIYCGYTIRLAQKYAGQHPQKYGYKFRESFRVLSLTKQDIVVIIFMHTTSASRLGVRQGRRPLYFSLTEVQACSRPSQSGTDARSIII